MSKNSTTKISMDEYPEVTQADLDCSVLRKNFEPVTKKDYIMAAIAGIAGAFIIYYKTSEIGALSIIISIISGILIILLSILVLQEDEEDDN